jgi:heat shock protein HslJ
VKKYLIMLLIICLAISACTAKNEGSAAALIGSWKLTSFSRADVLTPAVTDTEAGLTFKDDGTVTGSSGCNGFGGSYTVEDDKITFSEITSTLMACDDPRMAQEDVVHQVLTDIATFKIEGNTLTITNNDMVLVLTR